MSKLADSLRAAVGVLPLPIDLEGATKVGRVMLDNANGIGATPVNNAIDYFGLGMMMRPREFLSLNPPRVESIDWVRNKILGGNAFSSPYLKTVFDPQDMSLTVRNHEGRGRSMVMNELQPEIAMPVHMEVRKQLSPQDLEGRFVSFGDDTVEMRSREIDPEKVLRSWVHPDTHPDWPNPDSRPFRPRMIIHQGRSYFMPPGGKMMDITDDIAEMSLLSRALRGANP